MQELEKIWMNGELIDWADAKIHVGSHGLHYGSGVFEGIRAYETPKGSAVFRLTEHMQRLQNSARLLNMELPYTLEELRSASMDLIGANGVAECYLRPIAFFGYGELGVAAAGNPVDVVIMSWPWGTYLGVDGFEKGIRAKISSWTRVGPNVIPHVAKATGIYLNSMLAVMEANRAGYDEAILLTDDGFIADGRRERVRRERRNHLHARPVGVDPAGHHPRHDHPDRPGPRLPGCGEAADPHGSVSRRRGVHDRHCRGSDTASRGRRPADRRSRPGHTDDPERVPRHGPRQERALVALAGVRSSIEGNC